MAHRIPVSRERWGQSIRNLLTRGDKMILFAGSLYRRASADQSPILTITSSTGLQEFDRQVFVKFWPPHWPWAPKLGSTALLISGFGRFGNMVIQLCNLIVLAERLGIRRVYFWRNGRLGNSELELSPGIFVRRAPMLSPLRKPPPRTIIRTRAFRLPQLPEGLSQEQVVRVRKALSIGLDSSPNKQPCLSEDVLVIHLRAGDVFGASPHPGYGQPPLSFYTKVLAHREWSRVLLVAEDDSNPCLRPLIEICQHRDIPVTLRGIDLDEALQTLRSATSIVISQGTFVPAVLWLEPRARTIYSFGARAHDTYPLSGARLMLVEDESGNYESEIMANNWRNSDPQRELMLNYPESALSLHDVGV